MFFDFTGKSERACLKEMVHGYNISSALYVAVRLGVSDRLESGPKSAEALARECGADCDALKRILRLLIGAGVYALDDEGLYRLSPRAEYLRKSHPESIADEVLLFAGEETYLAWSRLLSSAKTGRPAFVDYFGKPLFEYLDGKPESAERFHSGWKEISTRVGDEIADRFDFSASRRVLDIGGGSGVVVASILRRFPRLDGVVYDLEFSLGGTRATLEKFGVGDRCATEAGDAKVSVPGGADVHLLKSVLHNCPDPDAVAILRNSARALGEDGRVLVIERVVDDRGHLWGNVVDVAMLVMTGGRERTLRHYGELYAQAGLRLVRCQELPSGFSVLEGRPAPAG